MSNSRPPLQRKQTRSSESARKAELDVGLTITVDKESYTVRQGDLTSMDIANLRRETGYSFRGLMMAASRDPDIDIIAALVWLARRIRGEQLLSYEDVANEIGYDVDVELREPEEGDDPPEA